MRDHAAGSTKQVPPKPPSGTRWGRTVRGPPRPLESAASPHRVRNSVRNGHQRPTPANHISAVQGRYSTFVNDLKSPLHNSRRTGAARGAPFARASSVRTRQRRLLSVVRSGTGLLRRQQTNPPSVAPPRGYRPATTPG